MQSATAFLIIGKLSPLEKWGAIWAIVAGVIAAILFVGGVGRFIFGLYRRPRVEIETGDGAEFDKWIVSSDNFVKSVVEDNSFAFAAGKMIKVRETKGRSSAKGVVVRITNVQPPSPDFRTATLMWSGGDHEVTIQPHGFRDAFLQHVTCFETADRQGVGARATPPILEHADPVEADLEILIDGRKHRTERIRIEHLWPRDLLDRRKAEGKWPDDLIYPAVTKLS